MIKARKRKSILSIALIILILMSSFLQFIPTYSDTVNSSVESNTDVSNDGLLEPLDAQENNQTEAIQSENDSGLNPEIQLSPAQEESMSGMELEFTNETSIDEAAIDESIDLPDIPSGIILTVASDNIKVVWEEVYGATGYDIEADGVEIDNGSLTEYVHQDLDPNTEHRYRIRSKNTAGTSLWSETYCSTTADAASTDIISPGSTNPTGSMTETTLEGVPAVPANVVATAGTDSITVTWDIVSDATAYEVEADGAIIESIGNTYLHAPLIPGTQHTYMVRSKNDFGASVWSHIITATVIETISAIPTNITTSASSNSITLNWEAIPNATGYEVEADGVLVENIGSNTYTHAGLTPSTQHQYKVRSKNSVGSSDWSGVVTQNTLPETPAIPVNFSASSKSDGIQLTWDSVSNATGYDIEINGAVTDIGLNTTYLHTGLTANTRYTYRVRAKNLTVFSDWSASAEKAWKTVINTMTLNQNTTWDRIGSPYILQGNVTVSQGVELKVMEGTVVQFLNNAIGIDVNGILTATGSTDNMVVFTVVKDPDYGGSGVVDTIDYGGGIRVKSTGAFNCTHAKLQYGLYNNIVVNGKLNISDSVIGKAYFYGINIYTCSTVTIENTVITGAYYYGIYIRNSAVTDTGVISIRNNQITGNPGNGIYVEDASAAVTLNIENNVVTANKKTSIYIYKFGTGNINVSGNTVKDNLSYPILAYIGGLKKSVFENINNNSFSGNVSGGEKVDAVGIYGGATIADITITNNNNQYLLCGSDVEPSIGNTLTVQPGIVFRSVGTAITVKGKMNVICPPDAPTIFTTISDPLYGGNGITDLTKRWRGISISSTGELNGDGIIVCHGMLSNIDVRGKLNLMNSVSAYASSYGLYFNTAYQPVLLFNSFIKNGSGVFNYIPTQITINAQYNYWNSVYGPKYETAPFAWVGNGEMVSKGFDYKNWLGSDLNGYYHLGKKSLSTENEKSKKVGETGVYAPIGNYSYSHTDFTYMVPGFELKLTRMYNSAEQHKSGVFGAGWISSLDSRVENYITVVQLPEGGTKTIENPSVKVIRLPDGSTFSFTYDENTKLYKADNSRNKLSKESDGTYTLKTKDMVTYYFSEKGYLTQVKDRDENTLTYTVDDSGKTTKLTDQAGRDVSIGYNTQGLIDTVTDPENRMFSFTYDGSKLTAATDPMSYSIHYGYDTEGYLNAVMDDTLSVIESITYKHADAENKHRVDTTTDVYGNIFTYSYDNANKKTTITDSQGKQMIQDHDDYFYVTKTQDAEGKYHTVQYAKDQYSMNSNGEEKVITDRNGGITQYDRDSNGNIIKVTNPDSSYNNKTYDSNNNIKSVTDESGKKTYFFYDSDNKNLIKRVQPLNGTDAYVPGSDENFSITEYAYYTPEECVQYGYSAGLLKSVTDPENNKISYSYDENGYVTTITDGRNKTITMTNNSIGWLLTKRTAKGYLTAYTYDSNGNLEKKVQHEGETSRMVYDAMNRLVKEVSPNLYDPNLDDIANQSYSGDHGYRYTYYPSGRVETATDPEDNTTTYTYDKYGNIETETKPNGAVYKYTYDGLNRLTGIYFKEDAASQEVLLKEYEYITLDKGQVKRVETEYINDQETLITEYTYDYAERLTEIKNPGGTTNVTVYNTNGTVFSTKDENGKVTYYKYDGLNRLTDKWVPLELDTGVTKYAYYGTSYYKNGLVFEEKTGLAKVNKDAKPVNYVIKAYEYDEAGNVTKRYDNDGRMVELGYDDDGILDRKDSYTDEVSKNTIEYINNHLGKPVTETAYIRKGDIYGNDFSDDLDTVLVTEFTYDANGNLKTVEKPNGVITTFEYDNMDRQTAVREPGYDELGNQIVIEKSAAYDWEGKLLSSTDANHNTTNYSYNQRGFLEKIVDAKQGATAYYYDRIGRKTIEIAPNHYMHDQQPSEMNRTEYAYDMMDRLKTQTEIYFDTVTSQWETVVVKAYKYDGNGNVLKELDALGYEAGSGVTADERIDSGQGTEYTYNYRNLVSTILEPESKAQSLSYTRKFAYDALGRKISETNAKGAVTLYSYDNEGNLLTTNVKKSASGTEQTIETNTYDWTNNLLTKTDGNGNTISYEYNTLGKLRTVVYPGDATIPGKAVTYQYDSTGNLKEQKDSTGKVNRFSYDNQNRLISEIEEKEGGTEAIALSYRYDANGNKRFAKDGNQNEREYTYDALNLLTTEPITVSGVQQTTTYSYDANSNLLTKTDWRGNTYTNVYDPLNRMIEKKNPDNKTIEKLVYNHNGAQVKAYNALGYMTQFQYDKNNRLVCTIDPENHAASQTYDKVGNVETRKDGRNNATTYVYDEFNRLQTVTNAKNETTTYTYDLNGNLLTQTDGKEYTTTYEYNVGNKPVRRIDHGGRTGTSGSYTYDLTKREFYTYYADGSLATKLDRNSIQTSYEYDIHGRLTEVTAGSIVTAYTYDNNGNQLTMTDTTGITTRQYDELNRTKQKTVPVIGTTTFTYDIIAGLPNGYTAEQMQDPKSNVTLRVFDKEGRIKEVTTEGNTVTYTYNDDGNRQSVVYQGGAKEVYTYYKDNLIKTLTNQKADGTIIGIYSYAYDGTHNQTSKTDAKGETVYTYDVLNRLETVTEPDGKVTTFTFDKAGNRVTQRVVNGADTTLVTYTYNNQNRLTNTSTTLNGITIETVVYGYDNNGNQLTITRTEYQAGQPQNEYITTHTYDKLNQLIMTEADDGATIGNVYNGEGLRVEKNVNGQRTIYLYEYDKIVLEVDGAVSQTARNVYGTNLLMRKVDGETLYYMYNGHGDVTELINSAGTVRGSYYYDAFGNLLESTSNLNNNIAYAGYQYDQETGLYYLNARMYDPLTARFLQEDTYRGRMDDPLSLNLYTYCQNEPIMYWDPSGHVQIANMDGGGISIMDWDPDWLLYTSNGYHPEYNTVAAGAKVAYNTARGIVELGEFAFTTVYDYGNLCSYQAINRNVVVSDRRGREVSTIEPYRALSNEQYRILEAEYSLKVEAEVEVWKQMPGAIIQSLKESVKTTFNTDSAYNFLFNPYATIEEKEEYMSSVLSTFYLAKGVQKGLTSGYRFLKGRAIIPATNPSFSQTFLKSIDDELQIDGAMYGGLNRPSRAAKVNEAKPITLNRPSWRQTEDALDDMYPGSRSQVAFKNAVEVPMKTKDSVRPDRYMDGLSIEAKNYDVSTKAGVSRLIKNVSDQVKERVSNLPKGTVQDIVIDLRGQAVDVKTINNISKQIFLETDGYANVKFLR